MSDSEYKFYWRNGKLLRFKVGSIVKDITKDFIKNSTPNKGRIEFADNYNYAIHKDEIDGAYWLMKKFGGNIYLNQEEKDNKYKGISNPDYIWNGKWWDLKGVKTLNGISKRLQDGIHQINNNNKYVAGGVLIDITGCNDTKSDVLKVISNRLNHTAKSNMKVIVKKDDDIFAVIEYKK